MYRANTTAFDETAVRTLPPVAVEAAHENAHKDTDNFLVTGMKNHKHPA
jgi:hypothetical protein